jgi:hypothetical protein
MMQDDKDREYNRLRQQRFRSKDKRNATVTDDVTDSSHGVSVSVTDSVTVTKNRKRATFIKPTLEEIATYCRERRNGIDPELWLAHYTSNDWMVGKNKMRDWKAAIITWEKRNPAGGNGSKPAPKESRYSICPKCKKEVLPADCFEKDCIHCAPRVPLSEIKKLTKAVGKEVDLKDIPF